MRRIPTILPFAILLLAGTVSSFSDAKCEQTVTWIIKNGTVNGQQYTFEVWARATGDTVEVRGTQSVPNKLCIVWNSNALHADLNGVYIHFASRYASPNYFDGYSSIASVPGLVGISVSLRPPPASPAILSMDAPDGEIILWITLVIDDSTLGAGLGWGSSYMPNTGIVGAANTFTFGTNALPIQLASFMVQTYGTSSMRLTWATLSEINNYGFEVQRSPDGKLFASIAGSFVPGNGTTILPHTYSYVDAHSSGTPSYRLKQIDLDGTVNYSEAVQPTTTTGVKELKPMAFTLGQNYPNPFNPSTQITFAIGEGGPVSLRVYDVLGREVATLVNENRNAGRYAEHFNGSQIASGVYVYVLRTSEGQRSGHMILSR